MPRLILVSNRLPVTIKADPDRVVLTPSAGGLTTGLRAAHSESDGVWIGWPGDTTELGEAQQAELAERLAASRFVPLDLTRAERSQHYEGFSNAVIWPLFHYLLDRVPLKPSWWSAYRRVNERMANLVAEHHQPGDLVWVHDYQLMLVPAMLRRLVPDARIGFFLHIPFPSTEVFRILPWRAEILEGLLGADLVGFHTFAYLRHFARSLVRVIGAQLDIDRIAHDGRQTQVGVFPMGIHASGFEALAADPEVERDRDQILSERPGERILLGIDRLDYTKGLTLRLLAVERLLEREPALREKVRLVQIAVPSRTGIDEYRAVRRRVDEMVGRINGAYGTVNWVPIRHLFQSCTERRLVSLYRAADVMLVTPVRDGMNLVAKEFVASRTDDDGVLLLSEFAGAADELGGAVQVNPHDVEATARAIGQALAMTRHERQLRMQSLRQRVRTHDVHRWVDGFLGALDRTEQAPAHRTTPAATSQLLARIREAPSRLLLLDYDGTLMPFASAPALAEPDAELIRLLTELAEHPGTHVHVVSGRGKDTLEAWFGNLPIGLHAEHGLWSRPERYAPWTACQALDVSWKDRIRPILEQFAEHTPGALIEEKDASLAWHYRMAEAEFGEIQGRQLCLHLGELLTNVPVEVQLGSKKVEIKPHGVHKGLVVPPLLAGFASPPLVIAMGNDQTDEDLYRALPAGGVAIQVGPASPVAEHRLADPRAARGLLWAILKRATRETIPPPPSDTLSI